MFCASVFSKVHCCAFLNLPVSLSQYNASVSYGISYAKDNWCVCVLLGSDEGIDMGDGSNCVNDTEQVHTENNQSMCMYNSSMMHKY